MPLMGLRVLDRCSGLLLYLITDAALDPRLMTMLFEKVSTDRQSNHLAVAYFIGLLSVFC